VKGGALQNILAIKLTRDRDAGKVCMVRGHHEFEDRDTGSLWAGSLL